MKLVISTNHFLNLGSERRRHVSSAPGKVVIVFAVAFAIKQNFLPAVIGLFCLFGGGLVLSRQAETGKKTEYKNYGFDRAKIKKKISRL